MEKEEYQKFYKLLTEIKELLDNVVDVGYIGHDIKLGDDAVHSLNDVKEKLKFELVRIKLIKNDYMPKESSHDIKRCYVIDCSRRHLLWSKNGNFPVALYDFDDRNRVPELIKSFEGSCGILTVFPDNKSFVLIEKEKSYYNFKYISSPYSCKREKIIDGVKKWTDLNDNLIIFELIDDKGIAVYDKLSNNILFEGVDSVKNLDMQFGNYFPDKNYIVEKVLHFENENLVLKFFIDKSGNVVSDLFDSNFCLYEIKNRNCREKVSSTLNQLFREIEKNYMRNGYQLVKKEK